MSVYLTDGLTFLRVQPHCKRRENISAFAWEKSWFFLLPVKIEHLVFTCVQIKEMDNKYNSERQIDTKVDSVCVKYEAKTSSWLASLALSNRNNIHISVALMSTNYIGKNNVSWSALEVLVGAFLKRLARCFSLFPVSLLS